MSIELKPSNSVFGPSTVNGQETIKSSTEPQLTLENDINSHTSEYFNGSGNTWSIGTSLRPSSGGDDFTIGTGIAGSITPIISALRGGDVNIGPIGTGAIILRPNAALTNATGIRTGATGANLLLEASGTLYLQNDNSGNVIANLGGGNFGVGTTSPQGAFHVKTATNANLYLANSGTTTIINSVNDANNAYSPLRFAANNYGFGGDVASGNGVIFIANDSADPSANPTGGGYLFASSGALKWRGSSGTVTTIAAA